MVNFIVVENHLWIIYACMSALFAALTTIFAKMGLLEISANLGTAIRTAIVLPMAWSLVWLDGSFSQLREINPKAWLTLLLSGLAGGVSWLFYFQALKVGKVSQVAPIDKLSVVITIIFFRSFPQRNIDMEDFSGSCFDRDRYPHISPLN